MGAKQTRKTHQFIIRLMAFSFSQIVSDFIKVSDEIYILFKKIIQMLKNEIKHGLVCLLLIFSFYFII